MRFVIAMSFLLFPVLAISATGHAHKKFDPAPIKSLLSDGARIRNDYVIMQKDQDAANDRSRDFGAAMQQMMTAQEDIKSIGRDFDAEAAPAVRAAATNERLANAVRDYYAAASACFESAKNSSLTTRANCEKMDTAEKSVTLELQLID